MDIMKDLNINGVFLLYLIIAANFLAQTFSCDLQNLLNNNQYLKHLIGFLTLHFFVTLTSTDKKLTKDKTLYFKQFSTSILLYIVFIMSTRMIGLSFGLFFILITAVYLINSYADTLDPDEHKKYIDNLRKLTRYLTILSIVVLVSGFLMYYGEKKLEYKDNWDMSKFLFGNVECKNNTDNYTYTQIIKGIFS
jgi:hypothetical protein